MVKRIVAIVVILISIAANSCLGEDKCTKPTEFMPRLCPITFPKIIKVRIEKNAARSSVYDIEQRYSCSDFIFTEEKVRQYLSLVMTTDRQSASNVLDWSPCYASGNLTFENGRTAHWNINQGQAGTISTNGWEDSESGDVIYLYCPKCKFKPLVDTSDEGMEDSSDGSE
jgi:hypothetical protein